MYRNYHDEFTYNLGHTLEKLRQFWSRLFKGVALTRKAFETLHFEIAPVYKRLVRLANVYALWKEKCWYFSSWRLIVSHDIGRERGWGIKNQPFVHFFTLTIQDVSRQFHPLCESEIKIISCSGSFWVQTRKTVICSNWAHNCTTERCFGISRTIFL